MPKCFVIMPISTPRAWLERYGNDSDHFLHVLEYLFIPALEELDYECVPPSASGADVIHAQIIKNLDEADLVLCDMSTLNANVFFEFGIRTALNKAICVVKDDVTEKVPFDASIINYHTYDSRLAPWKIKEEVPKLVKHIGQSVKQSQGESKLWKYFGLSQVAHQQLDGDSESAALQLVLTKLEALERRVSRSGETSLDLPKLEDLIYRIVAHQGHQCVIEPVDEGIIIVHLLGIPDEELEDLLITFAQRHAIRIRFEYVSSETKFRNLSLLALRRKGGFLSEDSL